ncbi:MAG TPA: Glu/Leu/Phe/Val dehydrogenase dimerization domain-containing protein [Ktedonobacterales bacterium]
MSGAVEQVIAGWDGEDVLLRYDRPTGAWIVIAVHSMARGPAGGGTRMKAYPSLAATVEDATRLAQAMTLKWALSQLPFGGGKTVISVPGPLDTEARRGLLTRYGELLASLRGRVVTGPDVGTSPADMDVIHTTGAPHVFARTPAAGGAGDSGPPTAIGVFAAIETTCETLFGDPSPRGKSVVVQGAGSVGERLIALLREAGADVAFSEVAPQRIHHFRDGLGLRFVAPEHLWFTACDILAPCALGGVLTPGTIAALRCRAVVGSANNQLASPQDAALLRDRGILFAPDYVTSLGGSMAIVGQEMLGWSAIQAEAKVRETVATTLAEVYARAERTGQLTTEAAMAIAAERTTAVSK